MSDIFSRPVHEWFYERYPDPDDGAHLNFDEVITTVRKPLNLKVFYRIEVVDMQCWFTFGGVAPAQLQVLYADPMMFDILEQELDRWEAIERESVATNGESLRGCYVTSAYKRLEPGVQYFRKELVVGGG